MATYIQRIRSQLLVTRCPVLQRSLPKHYKNNNNHPIRMTLPLMYIVLGCLGLVHGAPGLRKIPKVYNALVTTDQNLAPSRAYPVIQPVVHRTAIGYVPPFYYSPIIGPNYDPTYTTYGGYGAPYPGSESTANPGIEIINRNPEVTDNPEAERVDIEQESSENNNNNNDNNKEIETNICDEKSISKNPDDKKQTKEQIPLSFYPNYRSYNYDPYFHGYNPYPQVPFGPPGTYYVDYQHRELMFPGQIGPVGNSPYPESPRNPEENNDKEKRMPIIPAEENKEKIPDVPPPPVPTQLRSRKSS